MKSSRSYSQRRNSRLRGFQSISDRELAESIAAGDTELPMLARHASATLLRSPMGRAIELHVFPGRISRRALVIGGVHGTEFVGVEVTRRLVTKLQAESGRNERPFFTTIVVPELFPDNLPASHGGQGRARRATRGFIDPNRQFPAIGTGLHPIGTSRELGRNALRDSRGRRVELANVALIELIRQIRPRRIVSVHAIRRPSSAGIYADPHRGRGTHLGNETADLADRMHSIAKKHGGHVPGSVRGSGEYPHHREVSAHGVSLGAWGSRAVKVGPYRRGAIPIITIELKRDWTASEARRRRANVDAFVHAIRQGFLEP